MSRAPTSLLLLIDRRNRLAGEVEKLQALKREAADLHRHVSALLNSVDEALLKHPIRLDADILEPARTARSYARGHFGWMTKLILGALKESPGVPLTSTQIRIYIDGHWPPEAPRPEDPAERGRRIRRRLWNMRHNGALLSPAVGDGVRSNTTWIINPDRWRSSTAGSESTQPTALSPGNSPRTKAMARNDGCG